MAARLSGGSRESVTTAFEAAAGAAGGVFERRYRMAGLPILVRSAGAVASEWLDATFHHLSIDDDGASVALTVLAWDGCTGGPFPLQPSSTVTAAWERRPWFLEYIPEAMADGPVPWHRISGLLDDATAVYWLSAPSDLSAFERGTPLLTALQRWLAERHIQVVHGGAVAVGERAALIAGDNGAGKSATAMACYEAGLDYLADDYVAIEVGPPRAQSLFASAKLAWDHPAKVGLLLKPANDRDRGDDKALYLLSERVASSAMIRAIVAPRVSADGHSVLVPMTPGRALMSLAPSSILQLAGGAAERLAVLRSLCAEVPAYELVLGNDARAIGAIVRELLES